MRRVLRILAVLGFCGWSALADARDFLDTFNGRGWSPDSNWLAFNPVGQNELFIISPKSGKSFLLKPVGDVVDTRNTFTAEAASKSASRGPEAQTLSIGSPGKSKLESVEWSPDSASLAYAIDRKTRTLFSLDDQAITNRVSANQALPWQSERDLRVTFELVAATKDHEASYWMRAVRPNGKTVKEISFENPREMREMSLLRFSEAAFLSPDKQLLMYPRLREKGWQLMLHPVAGSERARPLTAPTPEPPLEWRMTSDSRFLAVAENTYSLVIGAIDNWDHAEKVPLPNLSITMAWSPDGRYLACNGREQLYLLARATEGDRFVGDFFLISDFCAPTFWGWRGTKLYFSDVRSGSTSLLVVDTDHPRAPEQIVKPGDWQSAPRERTISPDGSTFVCLMMEQDSEGRLRPQLWKIDLKPGAEWRKLYTFKLSQ